MGFVHPYWVHIAQQPEAELKEALLTDYKMGKPFSAHFYDFFIPGIKAKRILDFGCGIGRNFPSLRDCGERIVAYDIPEMLQACRRYADCTAVDIVDNWSEVIEQHYDVGVLTLVLQHLDDTEMLDRLLADLAGCCDFLYVTTRCWIDGEAKANSFKTVMNSGDFDVLNSNISTSDMQASNFPDQTHYDLLLRSKKPDVNRLRNDFLFGVRGRQCHGEFLLSPRIGIQISRNSSRDQQWGESIGRLSSWGKIKEILQLFEQSNAEWVFCHNGDVTCSTSDVRFELLHGDFQHADLILPNKYSEYNYELVSVRNSEWSNFFLKEVWDFPEKYGFADYYVDQNWEAKILDYFYTHNLLDFKEHCDVAQSRVYNYFAPEDKNLIDGVHLLENPDYKNKEVDDNLSVFIDDQPAQFDPVTKPYKARLIWAVYSCERNRAKMSVHNRYWLELARQDPEVLVFVFFGQEQSRDRELSGHEIELDIEESYANLAKKTLLMIQWIETNCDYEYMVKIDDDVAVLDYLGLKEAVSLADYTGYMIRIFSANALFCPYHDTTQKPDSIPIENIPPFYAQGGCYGLSRSMAKYLASSEVEACECRQSFAFEDTMIGRLVFTKNEGSYSICHNPNLATSPLNLQKKSLTVTDLNVAELVLAYQIESSGDIQSLVEAWEKSSNSRLELKYYLEYERGITKLPFLESSKYDSKYIGEIGRFIEMFQFNMFNSVNIFSDRFRGLLENTCKKMAIESCSLTSANIGQYKSNTDECQFLVVDSIINYQAMSESFIDILNSLPKRSKVFFMDADASKVFSLLCLSMVRSGKYSYEKAGSCLVLTKTRY